MASKKDLLLEIGCEELPASFVEAALAALPDLAKKRLDAARLTFDGIRPLGTPRRLALLVQGLSTEQPDLSEEVMGPPVRAAFKDGAPTRAAEAFAEKLGVKVAELRRVDTPKGEYLAGTRSETGRPASALLPELLSSLIAEVPFRKSMRWADLDFAFGRPIQWVVALFGEEVVPFEIAAVHAGRVSHGHRFLSSAPVAITSPSDYVAQMKEAHVLVDTEGRRAALALALEQAAKDAGGALIPDEFLVGENLSLVEEPHVVVGGFETTFLELPERVILEVAKGHQRYFGVRAADGSLMPKYLAVVNTALEPALIRKGNDRVMRARLADARFFYTEDLKVPLASRRDKLGGVVFQKRLGTVLEKVERMTALVGELGELAGLPAATIDVARHGARLSKCDLVSLMVGEFPELQGDMGASYARAQGTSAEIADVIKEHYRPKGASDACAPTDAAALVAIADRVDTLVGCLSIGLVPTGSADPFALRRAALGILRTMLDRRFDLSIDAMARAAHGAFAGKALDLSADAVAEKVGEFMADRLRGLLSDRLPSDVVRASLGAGADRPLDVERRAIALAELDGATRAQVGEVFKRATNIASQATAGDPVPPTGDVHASEAALFETYGRFAQRADDLGKAGDYAALLREVAAIAPVMHKYFTDVLVMAEDLAVRENRLRLMRSISDRCARVAKLELLAAQ
jgi:glycyl-tRNA synthetase beta chain